MGKVKNGLVDMKYIIETTTTMKEYNMKKWWIEPDIIKSAVIDSKNIDTALKQYQKEVNEKYYIEISNSALKNKKPIYIDTDRGTIQAGYCITGKTEFLNDTGKWTQQYIDLWIDIITVVRTEF